MPRQCRGGARAALREAAEEAGERLARRGARQAAKELTPVVIGENMKGRVVPYARRYGYQTIEDFIAPSAWTPELNKQWIMQMMREGRRIIDIGPDFARRATGGKPSPFYGMERRLTKGYLRYERRFLRWGKLRGGNPEVDIADWHYILDEF